MSRSVACWTATLVLVALLGPSAPAQAWPAYISAYAGCNDGTNISVHWDYYEDPQNPVGHPEWVGYDVLRRAMDPCGAWERVNPTPFIRTPGANQSFAYAEAAPSPGIRYAYEIITVDAGRNWVFLLGTVDCQTCAASAGCPAAEVPLTQGTVMDWGWTLCLWPCAGTCYDSYYAADPEIADQLRPYLGTDTALRVYGQGGCGTVEGCAVTQIDRIEILPSCGPIVPVPRTSWGQVKVLYR